MRLLIILLALYSATSGFPGIFDELQTPNTTEHRGPPYDVDRFVFDSGLYGSVLQHVYSQCPVPENFTVQRDTGLLPDLTTPCFIYSNDPADSQKYCQNACSGNSSMSDVSDGDGPAIICWALQYPNGDCQGQLITDIDSPSKGINVTLGRCLCDVPVIDYALDWFATKALPKIGNFINFFICEALWKIASTLIQIGIDAIPVAGPLDQAAWTLLSAVTGLTNDRNLTDIEIGNSFLDWLNPCYANTTAEDELLDYFDALASVAAARGLPVGPKRPRRPRPKSIGPPSTPALPRPSASSMPHASHPPETLSTSPAASPPSRPTESTPSPTPPPSSSVSPSASPKMSTSSSSEIVCHLDRRDVDIGRQGTESAWGRCSKGIYEMTTITSIIFGPQLSIAPKTCSSQWSHACAHYASVIAVSSVRGWDQLTCQSFHGSSIGNRKRPALTQWNREHKPGWCQSSWRAAQYCDRDEYPPVYFFADNDPVLANTQQLVRYLPASNNRGAGNGVWGPFCWTEGLKDPQATIVNMPNKWDTQNVNNGKTTRITRVTISVSHRPVFSIANFAAFGGLNMQDWGLAQNPCIPAALVNDKYFALLGTDPTLTVPGPNQASWLADYGKPPSAALTAAAVKVTSWNQKRDLEMAETSSDDQADSAITVV